MSIPLRVLILEDNPDDAELMVRELRRGGFAPEWQRVDTEAGYLARLDPALDVILADYNLPQFNAMGALRLLQGRGLDVPFIIVSGTVGEDTAVATVQQGASDYLLKDRLARLGLAVTRALQERQLRDERRRAEEQLFQAQKMEAIGTLAGGVAHDFNNILTGIIGFSQLALMGEEGGGEWREYVRGIPEQCERAMKLISQLLAFSRRAFTEPQPLPLLPFFKETIQLLERTVSESITIRLVAPGDVGIVNADPTQIQQVILNLCINASQAMPHGGDLTLTLERGTLDEAYCQQHADLRAGDYVCLSVRDTGVGMTPEVQERIFEPFYTTKGVGEGTGLGLAMVYGIVKAHAGHITVQSEVGRGSEFRVYLPAMDPAMALAAADPSAAQERLVGGTETLLMVEDEEMVLNIGRTMLERLGYTVLTATDGEEALKVYRVHREQVALVLTDMVMPKMGGQELYESLVGVHPAVKVLLMTGYSVKEDVADLCRKGLKGVLQKPFDFGALSRAVRQAIDS